MLEQDAGSDDEDSVGKRGGFGGRPTQSKASASVMTRTNRSLLGFTPVDEGLLLKNSEYINRWFDSAMGLTSF
jgi:hypothetical protein